MEGTVRIKLNVGLYIPSRGRAGKVVTLDAFPLHIRKEITIVCTPGEGKLYRGYYENVVEARKGTSNIGMKRQWILEHAEEQGHSHVIMFDDDLRFYVRRLDEPEKFRGATPADVAEMVQDMMDLFEQGVAQVGVILKQGSNYVEDRVVENGRMIRVLGFELKALRDAKADFRRCTPMEDLDVVLTMLRHGYGNALLGNYAQDQGGSNTEGGCSTYRTIKMQGETAEKLAKLHPNFVKVVQKEAKGAWGEPRKDVTVYWKKAYNSYLQGRGTK